MTLDESEYIEDMLDNDEITVSEEAFMMGEMEERENGCDN